MLVNQAPASHERYAPTGSIAPRLSGCPHPKLYWRSLRLSWRTSDKVAPMLRHTALPQPLGIVSRDTDLRDTNLDVTDVG